MKKNEATPGEWYAEDRVERIVIFTRAEDHDYEIASLDVGERGESALVDGELMAAAPALRDALRWALRRLNDHQHDDRDPKCKCVGCAALAESEGK